MCSVSLVGDVNALGSKQRLLMKRIHQFVYLATPQALAILKDLQD